MFEFDIIARRSTPILQPANLNKSYFDLRFDCTEHLIKLPVKEYDLMAVA